MSLSTNIVILAGRLTRDPVMRQAGNSQVAGFGLAIDDSYIKDGQRTERTVFVDVDAWAKLAEHVAKYLKKGSPVLVEGKLQLDKWEGKDGTERQKIKVQAARVQFLENRREQEQRGAVGATPEPTTPSGDGSAKDDDIPF